MLALTRADLGVAMGSGSGATRAAAKIVLLDDSFATLRTWWRRVAGCSATSSGWRACSSPRCAYAVLLSIATAVVALAADEGLQGLRFPFLPRHLTLISTLTIGVPAFVLALAPSAHSGSAPDSFRVCCVLPFRGGHRLARRPRSPPTSSPGSPRAAALVADRTTAVITLSATALWVLALVARPYTWWRIALVAAMAAGMVLALTDPGVLHVLRPARPQPGHRSHRRLAIAACAGTVLTVFLALTHRLPGGRPLPDTSSRDGIGCAWLRRLPAMQSGRSAEVLVDAGVAGTARRRVQARGADRRQTPVIRQPAPRSPTTRPTWPCRWPSAARAGRR